VARGDGEAPSLTVSPRRLLKVEMTGPTPNSNLMSNLDPLLPPPERLAALRIVDANANRAAEGLRVVEEYCRFFLGDAALSKECKSLRHDLAELVGAIPPAMLAAARDTTGDVGTAISTEAEGERGSLRAVAIAGSKRVEQALRVIEEYAKSLHLPESAGFEQLRYRAYSLGRQWTLLENSRARLDGCRLYVLIDGRKSEDEFERLVASLVRGGVDMLQLRDKTLADRTLLARAKRLRELVPAGNGPLIIVNDRPDLALLAGADGVHVGQEELTVRDVRRVVGPEMLVGVSTHSLEQARQAVVDGASYIGCGPTFPSGTKSFDHYPGLDLLRAVAREVGLPAFAIGGITQSNLSDVLAAGFSRVAVSGSIAGAADAEKEARLMLRQLTAAASSNQQAAAD
jgi:thiamine-phosphate pyrophosphorylase